MPQKFEGLLPLEIFSIDKITMPHWRPPLIFSGKINIAAIPPTVQMRMLQKSGGSVSFHSKRGAVVLLTLTDRAPIRTLIDWGRAY